MLLKQIYSAFSSVEINTAWRCCYGSWLVDCNPAVFKCKLLYRKLKLMILIYSGITVSLRHYGVGFYSWLFSALLPLILDWNFKIASSVCLWFFFSNHSDIFCISWIKVLSSVVVISAKEALCTCHVFLSVESFFPLKNKQKKGQNRKTGLHSTGVLRASIIIFRFVQKLWTLNVLRFPPARGGKMQQCCFASLQKSS